MQDNQKSNINLENLTQNLHSKAKIYHSDYSLRNKLIEHFVERTNGVNDSSQFKLRNAHRSTFENLIEVCHYKILARKKEWKTQETFFFPYCNAGIQALGGLGTERTAINHRRRLLDTGVIIEEFSTGRGFKSYINPLFFWNVDNPFLLIDKYVNLLKTYREAEKSNPAYLALNALNPESFSGKEEAEKTLEYIEPVHKLTKQRFELNQKLNEELGARSGQGLGRKLEQKSPEASSAAAVKHAKPQTPKAEKKQKKGGRGGRAAAADFLFIRPLIIQFWAYARLKLYSTEITHLTPEAERNILNTLYTQYFNTQQNPGSRDQWLDYYGHMIERVDIAADWFNRRPNVIIPTPGVYFGPSSSVPYIRAKEMRFSRTLDFWKNSFIANELKKIHKEVIQHKKGKGRHKELSRLELFKLHQKRVLREGDKVFTDKFHQLATTVYNYV